MPLTKMPKPPFFDRRWLLWGACVLGLAGFGAAHAQRADRDQPLHAEADSLRYDEARRTSVFTGNVVITQGSILIRGAQVEVRQDAQGNQFGTVTGQPGSFRQRRAGMDEHIEGQAARIEYDSKTETVRFIGNAVLRRYQGARLNDETSGGLIVYNGSNDTFSVDGDPGNRTASTPAGRVRAMLTPAPRPDAPAPPPASPVPLRPSPQMDGGRP